MADPGARGQGAGDLGPALQRAFPGRRFLVVSNREPYEHRWNDARNEIAVSQPAGGLTAALDPLLQAVGGTWIAWGSGDQDAAVVDEAQRVRVPPDDPRYTLRRIWLNEQDLHHYYYGYANQFLWPLCHLRPALTRMRSRYWAAAVRNALLLTAEQRRERLQRLRGSLRTIYDWMVEVFEIWAAAAVGGAVPLSRADGWRRSR